MSLDANPLSEGDIAASNVLPAWQTSLQFGASEAELAQVLGWRREELTRPDARVSGTSTYEHLELMFTKPNYPNFVIAAARAHDAASLGLVGLACKTMPSVGAAMACHARFQRLTNRTATYETSIEPDGLHLREQRDDAREGSKLVSDYALLVAVHLLSLISGTRAPVRMVYSRRSEIPVPERAIYEREFGAPMVVGAKQAALVLEPSFVELPVQKADAELERYFRSVLERALPTTIDEPALLTSVKAAVREQLRDGHATLDGVAHALGLGSRTLQRRLATFGTNFQDVQDDTLKTLARGYLAQPQLTLAEVAWLLGYIEQASFFRAFRRWYGTTPDEYRKRKSAHP